MVTGGWDDWPDPLDGGDDGSGGQPARTEQTPEEVLHAADRRRRAVRLIVAAVGLAILVRLLFGLQLVGGAPTRGQIGYWASSSVFFVAVPAVLAWLLVRRGPRETAMGRVMTGTTVGLLLVSMVLGEGAVCVMLAAPIVYAVAGAVVVARRWIRSGGSFALVLVLLPLMQPTAATQVHEVTVVRVVDLQPDAVADAIAAGPDFAEVERPWLLTLGYAPPDAAERRMVDGDVEWTYRYGRGATTFRMDDVPTGHEFRVVEDTAMTRWFRWHTADLDVQEHGDGTRIELTLRFDPTLGPDWYFGTIEDWFMQAAGDHLLDALGLPEDAA